MKIAYITPYKIEKIVTGGEIYDRDLLTLINDKTSNSICLIDYTVNKHIPLLLTPLLYLFKAWKNRDYDVAIINSVFFMRFAFIPVLLKKALGKKAISVHHLFMYEQFKGIKRKIYRFFEWNFLKQMDKIIVPSPYIYEQLTKKIPEKKLSFHLIPFDRKALYPANPLKGNLTYMATIEPRKGLIHLIKALQILKGKGKNYKLKVIGKVVDKKYYDNIQKIIYENNLDVVFTGYLEKEEKDKILASTDVFVFPSLLEGYGMVIVEAQVYGLPIVAFNNSSIPYNVKNDINGYTVTTGDENAYAEAIERIVEDRVLRAKLSLGALENLKNQNTRKDFEESIKKIF